MKPPSLKDIADNRSSATISMSIISIGIGFKELPEMNSGPVLRTSNNQLLREIQLCQIISLRSKRRKGSGIARKEKGETLERESEGSLSRFPPSPPPLFVPTKQVIKLWDNLRALFSSCSF